MLSVLPAAPLKTLDSGALSVAILDAASRISDTYPAILIEAIGAAAYLHRGQTRANRAGMPRTPYSEHPLRNALRALRMGVTDLDVIAAIILHDTIEDCSSVIATDYLGMDASSMSAREQRECALDWMEAAFGTEITSLVKAVTNPLPSGKAVPIETRHQRYATFVHDAIHGDARVFIVKFVDFADNAAGLHHNVAGIGAGVNDKMAARLAAKYLPLIHIFEAELAASYGEIMTLVSAEGLESIIEHLTSAKTTLPVLIDLAA
ncbi:hypothetical protein [Arthrobacter caoxuetaonis]|uniref:HD domain-containing protein n=1 Tax=Arthrobacter caoxuetaonis TaxID=2886935 RepID=A0A9X1SGG2_9MICC|nr:hypothetical protein [Arthrobacter caoxuetaonis]MCC3299339.1 hypothetical protein [Arthrobacter caoxuetaonis]USQ59168.1 hypothetical protein NF551_18855 [Arthrobacter caoxuetaonis]